MSNSLVNTVWKFHNFTVTQILREIVSFFFFINTALRNVKMAVFALIESLTSFHVKSEWHEIL